VKRAFFVSVFVLPKVANADNTSMPASVLALRCVIAVCLASNLIGTNCAQCPSPNRSLRLAIAHDLDNPGLFTNGWNFYLEKKREIDCGYLIGGVIHSINVTEYITNSDLALDTSLNISNSVVDDGQPVEPFDAVLVMSSAYNAPMMPAFQAASLPMINPGNGNSAVYLSRNTFVFGLYVPAELYPRDLLRIGKINGLNSVTSHGSTYFDFSRINVHQGVKYGVIESMTVVGPTTEWCDTWGHFTQYCRNEAGVCNCAIPEYWDPKLNITGHPTFYAYFEIFCFTNLKLGCTIRFNTVSEFWIDFYMQMYADAQKQGVEPDIILDYGMMVQDSYYGLYELGYSPKMHTGWLFALPLGSGEVVGPVRNMSKMFAWWRIAAGQWHKGAQFSDPFFGSPTAFARDFEKHHGFAVVPEQAGAAAAGVALQLAFSKYIDSDLFNNVNTDRPTRRQLIRSAFGDLNDDTLWGPIRFNRQNMNNGRGAIGWQLRPNTSDRSQELSLCVMPELFAQTPVVLPMPTWDSRLSCRPGTYNDGNSCIECPNGKFRNISSPSFIEAASTECFLCQRGYGSHGAGNTECVQCEPGKYQELPSDSPNGLTICKFCKEGYFAGSFGSGECTWCAPGQHQPNLRPPNKCIGCPLGRNRAPTDGDCVLCIPGYFASQEGMSACDRCNIGEFANASGKTACTSCSELIPLQTTSETGVSSPEKCGCPSNYYLSRDERCVPCPEGMSCKFNVREDNFFIEPVVNVPLLDPEYYTKHDEPLSVYWCRPTSACPGGLPDQCAGGRVGFMCTECPDGQSIQQEKCREAKDQADILMVVCPILLTILFAVAYYKTNDPTSTHTSTTMGTGIILGLAVTVAQLLGTLGRLPLSWPSGLVGNTMSTTEVFLFNPDALSAEAVIGYNPLKRYLLQSLLPYACIAWFLILWILTNIIGMLKRNSFGWEIIKVLNSMGVMVQTIFIALVGLAVVPHQCYSHPNDNGTSIAEYPSVLCGEGDYSQMVVVSSILLATLVFPFMVLSFHATVVAGKFRGDRIHAASHLQRYRFLFYRFRPDAWWWGSVWNIRQLLLAFSSMVQPDDPHFQLIYVVVILTWYPCGALSVSPWRTIEANIFDGFSCCLLTLLVVTVGSLMPASELNSKHKTVVSCVLLALFFGAICNIAIALVYVLCKGRAGQFGVTYPRHKSLSTFTVEWQALGEVCSKLPPESMTLLLANMNDYDRYHLDKAISAVQGASVGQIYVTNRCSARLQGLQANSKQKTFDMPTAASYGVQKTSVPQQLLPHQRENEIGEHIQVFVSERCRFAASKHLTLKGASKVRPGIQ